MNLIKKEKNRYSRLKRHRVLLACLFLFLFSSGVSSASTQDSSADIISFMPDFYAFWEQAESGNLEEKMNLWDEIFESKHPDFYHQVIYEGTSGEKLEEMKKAKLKSFFSSLKKNDVKRMKSKESQIMSLISEALNDLYTTLEMDPIPTSHYIVPSLNTSSGAVRPFNGRIVAYYGLESLSRFDKPLDIKAIVFHESFHLLHFQNLFPALREKYKGDMNIFAIVMGEGALFFSFIEGLAVYTTELAYPDAFRPGLIEENVPLYQEHFHEYTREFLKDAQQFDYSKYEKYFLDYSQNPSIPAKFGYWLGYQVVKSLQEKYSLSEMMQWSPQKIKTQVSSEVERIY